MAGTPHLTEEYERGRVLYRAGDESRRVGVILSGCLEIRKYMADGRTVVMFQRRRGEMLGGSIVFSSAARYPCDVTAKDKTEMLWIDRDDVLEKLMRNAAVARSVLRLSSDRIMLLEKRVELFSLYSIQKKIAFSLLNDFDAEEGAVRLPFTKTAWAEYLNVSRTSLCRELKRMETDGIIKTEGRALTILDKNMLKARLLY